MTEEYPENVVWAPQEGSQEAFLASTPIFEVLYQGTRGGGKTDCLLFSFGMHTGQGFGPAWRGILFRQTYKQLTDVISKTKKWFPQIWPQAKFNGTEHVWTWPGGEQLLLRQFKKDDDYWNYHGHEYPWIGWEELCNWHSDSGYKRMMSCCRSSEPNMPRMVRSTTNPYGPGHSWVRARFRPDSMNMKVRKDIVEDGEKMPPRLSIYSDLKENKKLLASDPEYVSKIAASARNEAERKAWLEGSWDIVAGGMFSDVWDSSVNVIEPFDVPRTWRIDRSFDWGASRPFSVGWWARSDGSDVRLRSGRWVATVPGDLFRVAEWYGWTGKPNEGTNLLAIEISRGIVERELRWGWRSEEDPNYRRVSEGGPADSQIFAAENGNCIATDMKAKVRLENGLVYPGIKWSASDKRPGSRKTGWDQMRRMLSNSRRPEIREGILGPRERPGLFVFNVCEQFVRTVPVLPRDEKDMDDVDTDAEDHVADEVRYRVRSEGVKITSGRSTGTQA